MGRPTNSTSTGRLLRRLGHIVHEAVGIGDPPVASGLIDIENQYRWRNRS